MPEEPMHDASRDAEDITAYYAWGLERDRLTTGTGALELARTQALLERLLPAPPAVVADVGGHRPQPLQTPSRDSRRVFSPPQRRPTRMGCFATSALRPTRLT
jgi:hypothetical protein